MYPINLGNRTSALVLEVLKVLGRPVTIGEVTQRVADVYKLPMHRIKPVVGDVLESGVRCGFLSRLNRRYSVDKFMVDQLRRDIDEYAAQFLSMDGNMKLPQPSQLMLKLQQMDDAPASMPSQNRRIPSGEQPEHTPSGDHFNP